MSQPCARWGCDKSATYDKPLCYPHWCEWEAWELEECNRCHWFFSNDEAIQYWESDCSDEYPFMCGDCSDLTLIEIGKNPVWPNTTPEKKPVCAHAEIQRPHRYVYILKLADASFYVGQTNNLSIRLQEHRDGQQSQTRDRNPRLVFFEAFHGDRRAVNEREDELTGWNQTATGHRRLMEMIEEFRAPLRLLNLDA